jgi:tRNA threonylcarbamoyladenosine biosynthesis protein TsaE
VTTSVTASLPSLHPPILGTRPLHWPDEAACAAFARQLAASPLLRDAFIELRGPLGAGKTTFVRHLLRALGVAGRIKSPTYAVLEPYTLADGTAVSHLDFYRMADPHEWADAGLRDVFAAPGLKLAEWPERVQGLLPPPDLMLTIEPQPDDTRHVRCEALTPRGVALIDTLPRGAALIETLPPGAALIEPLPPGAAPLA